MRRCARRSPAGTSRGWRPGRGRGGCRGVPAWVARRAARPAAAERRHRGQVLHAPGQRGRRSSQCCPRPGLGTGWRARARSTGMPRSPRPACAVRLRSRPVGVRPLLPAGLEVKEGPQRPREPGGHTVRAVRRGEVDGRDQVVPFGLEPAQCLRVAGGDAGGRLRCRPSTGDAAVYPSPVDARTVPPTQPAWFTSWLRAPLFAVTWMRCPGAVAWAAARSARAPRGGRGCTGSQPRGRACRTPAAPSLSTVPSRRPEPGSSAHRAAVPTAPDSTVDQCRPGCTRNSAVARRVLRSSSGG